MRNSLLAFGCSICMLSGVSDAGDFRIQNKVFSGKQTEPVSESTTLFRAGIVYDYLIEPKRVAVFDKPHGKFILLDAERRLRTDIETAEVTRFSRELRDFAAAKGTPFVKSMLDPKFDPQMNDKTGELVLSGPSLTYRLETFKPQTADSAQQYREFSDWYVRLNAMTNPAATPPFARLAVNDELAKRGLIAQKVQLTIPPQVSTVGRGVTLRSEHHITWRLLPRDMDDIAETAHQLATYKQVPFSEYSRDASQVQRTAKN